MNKLQLHRKTPKEISGNLLYLMGATWKTKSMFDLDCREDSFCKILNKNNIETFAFDIPDTCHEDVLQATYDIVEKYNIRNVMGYSYGCIAAFEAGIKYKLDNVILLDPFSGTQIKNKEFDTYYTYNVLDVKETVDAFSNMSEGVKENYLNSLGSFIFNSPKYPKIFSKSSYDFYTNKSVLSLSQSKITVAFTNCVKEEVYSKYEFLSPRMYDSSHWILLEEGRMQLANDVLSLIRS